MIDMSASIAAGSARLVRRAASVLASGAVLCGLALVPTGSASALDTAGRAGGPGQALADTCWATHYGEGIPPGSFTASGEIFDANALTAATSLSRDPQLPFGTMVKVTNTANGASVTVRVNDRGGFAETPDQPFCLDLTDGAFARIGAISPDPGHFVVTQEIL